VARNGGTVLADDLVTVINVNVDLQSGVPSAPAAPGDIILPPDDHADSATDIQVAAAPTESQTVHWVGGSGDWNTGSNWSTGAPPSERDDV
jgi:hypothetical protein